MAVTAQVGLFTDEGQGVQGMTASRLAGLTAIRAVLARLGASQKLFHARRGSGGAGIRRDRRTGGDQRHQRRDQDKDAQDQ